ncbi:porin [Bordetella genomosp. 12]|uniref:Porin n=1 Tax=Bordetella genomosp. 12 TaxID=463035 RepID=A0A261VCE2_9BORD|nr:porin [Bordetella genomosp. 12]OZI71497.1 porin [Bordetella genomosp. 12]
MAGNNALRYPRQALAALLAASAWAGGAQADDTVLQLYGLVDAGISSTHVSGGASSGTRNGLLSGGQSDSLWGLRVSEPLGNGWKVNAGLESGFDLVNGSANTSGQLFDYGSWVGLANGRFGEIRLGRQATIGASYGSELEVAPWRDMGMGALFKASDNYQRNNLVNLYSPQWGGWQAGLGYAFDAAGPDGPPSSGRGHAWSAGLRYDSEPWLAVLTWDRLHPGTGSAAAGRQPSAWQAGMAYQAEGWKLALAWTRQRDGYVGQDGGGIEGLGPMGFVQGGRADAWLVGTEVSLGASSALLLQASWSRPDWSWEDGKRARTVQLYTLGWRQDLSPRTSVYAFVGRMRHGSLDDGFTPEATRSTRVAIGLTQQF